MNTHRGIVIALLITMMTVVGCGKQEPKCIWSGCDNNRAPGSAYCYLHELSEENRSNNSSYTGTTQKKTTTSSSTSTDSKPKTQPENKTSSGTKSNSGYKSLKSYDEGYEDVYENDDWDWDRYMEDDDYADGVDDALEDDWDW